MVTRVSESSVLTDHERINLSSSANMLSVLILQDTSVTAVIKSLVQYSKTFGSSVELPFQEAGVVDTVKYLVSYWFVQVGF